MTSSDKKIEREESFYFYYTDEEEVERLFYLRPVEETNWHFLLMVETEVFTEQSRMFIFSSIAMLVTAVFCFSIHAFACYALSQQRAESECGGKSQE